MIPIKIRRHFRHSRARLLIALVTAVTASAALVSPSPSTSATVTEVSLAPAAQTAPSAQPDATSTAAGTAPTKAQMIDGETTLSVDSLAPEIITSGQDLTISGTIANGTGEPLEGLSLTVQMEDSTEMTVTGLESWLAEEQDSAMRRIYQGVLVL